MQYGYGHGESLWVLKGQYNVSGLVDLYTKQMINGMIFNFISHF